MIIDLLATSLNHRCSLIFRPSMIPHRSVRVRFFRAGTGIRCIPFHLVNDTAGSEEAPIIF